MILFENKLHKTQYAVIIFQNLPIYSVRNNKTSTVCRFAEDHGNTSIKVRSH